MASDAPGVICFIQDERGNRNFSWLGSHPRSSYIWLVAGVVLKWCSHEKKIKKLMNYLDIYSNVCCWFGSRRMPGMRCFSDCIMVALQDRKGLKWNLICRNMFFFFVPSTLKEIYGDKTLSKTWEDRSCRQTLFYWMSSRIKCLYSIF